MRNEYSGICNMQLIIFQFPLFVTKKNKQLKNYTQFTDLKWNVWSEVNVQQFVQICHRVNVKLPLLETYEQIRLKTHNCDTNRDGGTC